MGRVADETATNKADEQVNKNNRQQPGPEDALETFRKLASKLDTKNKQHTD